MSGDTRQRKSDLRRQLLRRRAALAPDACASASDAIVRRLLALPLVQAARTVHTYVDALPNEVATRPFIRRCLDQGKCVVVPLVRRRRPPMEHAEVRALEELVRGPMDLLQPDPAVARWWTPARGVDVVVVPAVAYDRQGYRIGHGGGFYDTFLPACPGTPTVGIIYDALIVEEVPREEHDQAVDVVLTETARYGELR